MAAMMKYIGLESPEFHARLHELHAKSNESTEFPSKATQDHASSTNDAAKDTEAPKSIFPTSKTSPPTPKSQSHRILARLEAYRSAYLALTPSENFDTPLYTSVQLLNGTSDPNGKSGTATFRIAFTPKYCNKFGTVHGGAIATLLDGVSQCATAVVDSNVDDVVPGRGPGRSGGGATRGLEIKYCAPIAVGETVKIKCSVLKVGRRGGTIIRSTVRREVDDEIVAFCLMDKEGCDSAKL